MAAPEKRKISARHILSDIRAGMNGEQIKQKHGLSDKSLASVLSKMVAAGLLTEEELQVPSLSRPGQPAIPAENTPTIALTKCPACHASLASGSRECPVCGVIVEKFLARQEQESLQRVPIPEGDSLAGKRLVFILCALAIVVVAGGYFMFSGNDNTRENPTVAQGTWPAGPAKVLKQSGSASKARREARRAPNIFTMKTGNLLELKFAQGRFPLGLSVTQGSGGVHFFETPSANQGFKKFPPETDAKRYYDEFTIAGQTFLMITEASNPPKIYLDANRNGNMTDDLGPFAGERPSAAPNNYTLELPYVGEKTAAPYRLWLFPSNMGGIRFYPACYWEGQIELNGSTYRVVTFDGNADGDYSNDPVIVDADHDAKAADSERLKPGQSVSVDGTVVKLLAVAPSGRWVRLQY